MSQAPPRVSRLPLVVIGIMTPLTLLGPFGLLWILKGGEHGGFPPDRPVEWAATIGICGLVAALMLVSLFMTLVSTRELRRRKDEAARAKP